jgi:hypothetical protein
MEEQETGLSGSGRATGECWGPVGQAVLKTVFAVFYKVLRKNPKYMKSAWRKKKES